MRPDDGILHVKRKNIDEFGNNDCYGGHKWPQTENCIEVGHFSEIFGQIGSPSIGRVLHCVFF